eukprot:SAG22_NODE_18943_length_280_cov_0.392265_1_plen_46_part_10
MIDFGLRAGPPAPCARAMQLRTVSLAPGGPRSAVGTARHAGMRALR